MKTLSKILLAVCFVGAVDANAELKNFSDFPSSTVEFKENHDPSMIWLTDGQKIQVEYGAISFEEVEKWKLGRKLHILYSLKTGLVLQDSVTGKSIPIYGGLNEHPLHILETKAIQEHSTMGAAGRLYEISKVWNHEIDRLLALIYTDKIPRKFTEEELMTLRQSQQKWVDYRKSQRKAVTTYFSKSSGTFLIIKTAYMVLNINKRRADCLSEFLTF